MKKLSLIAALLLTACAPAHHAWRALNAPHQNYVARPYTRCMWLNAAPNAKLVQQQECEDK